jgi:N utilization substance protein B
MTREKVMELLYLLDIHRQVAGKDNLLSFLEDEVDAEKISELVDAEKRFLINDKDELPYFEATFNGVVANMQAIDETIQKYMKRTWSVDQIGFVERAILRLAVYELNWSEQEGLVTEVVIASALELAEKYTDATSGKFIHGILGAMTHLTTPKATTPKKHQAYKKGDKQKTKENLAKYKRSKAETQNK